VLFPHFGQSISIVGNGVGFASERSVTSKISRAPSIHDNIDFKSVVTGDKTYDSEANHVLIRERLYAFTLIQAVMIMIYSYVEYIKNTKNK
jgi:hypothetical protein